MKTLRRDEPRWPGIVVILLSVCLLLAKSSPPSESLKSQLDRLTANQAFNFLSWEVEALTRKVLYGVLAPHRFMDDEAQSRFVLDYLSDVREARLLTDEIFGIYSDPEVANPGRASQAQQAALSELRARMARHAPVAEAILESQVSEVLARNGVGVMMSVLPPVKGTFTPLPHVLVVSPRERIESVYQQQLAAGLTAVEQAEIEQHVTRELDDISAYVTEIGGLAAYPAMLLEASSIDWIADTMAHEWTHHYLSFFPLGWYYMRSGETRSINETTASLLGEWAGQEIMLTFYDPLFQVNKGLPSPLQAEKRQETASNQAFDFRAEMHHTRVTVDRLLGEGKVKEAEWYMEAQRRYFVAQGYRLRRLNQAYFAFHGAYASSPGGAAGADPIGPAVRKVWALSADPADFLRNLSGITTLEALQAFLAAEGDGN